MRFPVRILNQGSNCNEVAASIVLVILAITCADYIAIQFGICWVYRTRVASMEGGNVPPGNILPGGGDSTRCTKQKFIFTLGWVWCGGGDYNVACEMV